MKLSKRTIEILKNFSVITPGLIIKPGNTIAARPLKEADSYIYAIATVPDIFPSEIGIFNLTQFLSLITSMNDCELIFGSNNTAQIKSGTATIKYTFAEPSLLPQPRKIKLPDAVVEFELSQQNFEKLNNVSNTLGSTDIVFMSDGENIVARSTNEDIPNSNMFEINIGPCDKTFKVAFDVRAMIMIKDTYNVKIHPNCVSMTNVNDDLTYVVGINTKYSKI